MGLTTVIRDYGTEVLNAIRENDVGKLKFIVEKTLRTDGKIAKLFVTDIKHKPTKKFACPLILAARQEDSRIMKYMMEKGTDPNFVHHTIFSSKRREIVTALHLSVDLGFYNTAEVLLNANADANIYDHNQETPLHIAVKKADHTMMRLLLSKGADPCIPDRKNNAALHISTLYGHLQMVRSLLKYDADVYQKGQWEAIPPHIAAKEGHIHLLNLFCSSDVGNINVKIPCYIDQREKAPIHLAAENGHTECVYVLLDNFDADVNLKDSDGNTALHCVVLYPYDVHRMREREFFTESARVLIKFRVSINEKNIFGDTALHFAAMNHYHRVVELLLEQGANPFIENEDGMKPIDTVPDSDPVTKQILKMAMVKGRPNLDKSLDAQRRIMDSTMKSSRGDFNNSRSNVSYRSVSSMSSVFVDDPRSKKSKSRSKLKLEQTQEETPEEAGTYTNQSELAIYSQVNKKKQKRSSRDSNSNLGYDQQEWEQLTATTDQTGSDRGSVTQSVSSQHLPPTMTSQQVQADIPHRSRHQQTMTVETTETGTQQDYVERKNRKNRRNTSADEMSLDSEIPSQQPQVGQQGEILYQNLPGIVKAPPLPPRKNRPGLAEMQSQEELVAPGQYREEDGVQVHTLPGKPGTIEVQYKGGPITISVDTPKDFYEDGVEDDESEVKQKSPKQKKKPTAMPRSSNKPSPKAGHKGESPKRKHRKKSDEAPTDEYYNEYYQQKYVKRGSPKRTSEYDPYVDLEQSIEDYFSGTYEIEDLETLQVSMLSDPGQPELVKRIIQQKIFELIEQKRREEMTGQRTEQDEMQKWVRQTEQDEDSDEDEDIVDSDEWQDDAEFKTPLKWLDDEEDEEAEEHEKGRKKIPKGPMKSTPKKKKVPTATLR